MNSRKKGISLGTALLIALLIVLWRLGTFDHALYGVGLNAQRCAQNGYGAVFCGSQLTEYEERTGQRTPGVREENGHIVQEATPEDQKAAEQLVEERHAECAPDCVGENEPSG